MFLQVSGKGVLHVVGFTGAGTTVKTSPASTLLSDICNYIDTPWRRDQSSSVRLPKEREKQSWISLIFLLLHH